MARSRRFSALGNDRERQGLYRWLFASLPNRTSEFLVGIDTARFVDADGLVSA
jgi:hypothetical protein